ncbi:hypothetical protein EIN_024860 [Entamoeba invadens IP1]|uniref:hypothetical protein n=1 Tax=Entamoeba invadens IP1 TaxID=370355 RepID=UPI0002C3D804|nr:hypothetical protein EIN_024860 [Entamoeba invadens IP1]ELP90707.1 hypothetical protein EIN_024860 [Entamoeba invadens IP1]|eukprot:XP_004257478.1 hypothetical protein EIN_024860 [Entamoeba invadens IP1]
MSRLDGYHGMVVAQYFSTITDFFTLEEVSHSFSGTMSKFHTNPFPLSTKTLKYFPSIETLNIWSESDETFGNKVINSKCTLSPNKTDFFKIVVFYTVPYTPFKEDCAQNVFYKNIEYTYHDREKYGCVIPKEVTCIGNGCFSTAKLTTLEIPSNVVCINSYGLSIRGFDWSICDTLTRISLTDKITQIEENAFYNLKIEDIVLPKLVNNLQNFCFRDCTCLTRVVLHEGIESFGQGCFENCRQLTNIEIPNSVTSIGPGCFYQCMSINKLIFPLKLKVIPSETAYLCKQLTTVVIPTSVTRINANAFLFNYKLTELNLPDTVVVLGERYYDNVQNKYDGYFDNGRFMEYGGLEGYRP